MQRVAWTDERLDDMSRRMDAGFDRVDRDIGELRLELREGLRSLRTTLTRVGGGIMVGLLGVIVAGYIG